MLLTYLLSWVVILKVLLDQSFEIELVKHAADEYVIMKKKFMVILMEVKTSEETELALDILFADDDDVEEVENSEVNEVS